MDQSLFERERVNERFQRGSRRAWTARSVNLTVNVNLVEICRANLGKYVHRAGIDQKHRRIINPAIAVICDIIDYSSLNRSLLFQIEGRDHVGSDIVLSRKRSAVRGARRSHHLKHLLNEMRCEEFAFRLHARTKL